MRRCDYDQNVLWLTWYARGQQDAERTARTGTRTQPTSQWSEDQRAWRMGFADALAV